MRKWAAVLVVFGVLPLVGADSCSSGAPASTSTPSASVSAPAAPASLSAPPQATQPTPAQNQPQQAPANPYPDATAKGASAVCADGTYSYSKNRSGTCSSHGGVHWWTGNLGAAGPGAH